MDKAHSGKDTASSQLFFALAMVAASSLGMAKTLFLAVIMTPESFGQYATFFGLAVVGSILVSFGDVEGTIKFYPRLWVLKQVDTIHGDILFTTKKLVIRCIAGIGLIALILGIYRLLLGQSEWPGLAIFLTAVLILPMSVLLLLASAVRAAGSASLLISFTAFRGAMALALVLTASNFMSWEYLLLAETVAAIMSLLLFFPQFKKVAQKAFGKEDKRSDKAEVIKSGGLHLYLANLIASFVPYGGRAAINLLAGPAMAGAYSVLIIFVQMGQLLSGVISQRIGPQLIKWRMAGEAISVKTVGLSLLIVFAASIATFVMLWASFYWGVAAHFWQSYGIGVRELFVTCLAMCMSIYLILQFLLISMDREKIMLAISIMVVIFCYSGFYLTSLTAAGLVGFIMVTMLTDFSNICLSLVTLRRSRNHA